MGAETGSGPDVGAAGMVAGRAGSDPSSAAFSAQSIHSAISVPGRAWARATLNGPVAAFHGSSAALLAFARVFSGSKSALSLISRIFTGNRSPNTSVLRHSAAWQITSRPP